MQAITNPYMSGTYNSSEVVEFTSRSPFQSCKNRRKHQFVAPSTILFFSVMALKAIFNLAVSKKAVFNLNFSPNLPKQKMLYSSQCQTLPGGN